MSTPPIKTNPCEHSHLFNPLCPKQKCSEKLLNSIKLIIAVVAIVLLNIPTLGIPVIVYGIYKLAFEKNAPPTPPLLPPADQIKKNILNQEGRAHPHSKQHNQKPHTTSNVSPVPNTATTAPNEPSSKTVRNLPSSNTATTAPIELSSKTVSNLSSPSMDSQTSPSEQNEPDFTQGEKTAESENFKHSATSPKQKITIEKPTTLNNSSYNPRRLSAEQLEKRKLNLIEDQDNISRGLLQNEDKNLQEKNETLFNFLLSDKVSLENKQTELYSAIQNGMLIGTEFLRASIIQNLPASLIEIMLNAPSEKNLITTQETAFITFLKIIHLSCIDQDPAKTISYNNQENIFSIVKKLASKNEAIAKQLAIATKSDSVNEAEFGLSYIQQIIHYEKLSPRIREELRLLEIALIEKNLAEVKALSEAICERPSIPCGHSAVLVGIRSSLSPQRPIDFTDLHSKLDKNLNYLSEAVIAFNDLQPNAASSNPYFQKITKLQSDFYTLYLTHFLPKPEDRAAWEFLSKNNASWSALAKTGHREPGANKLQTDLNQQLSAFFANEHRNLTGAGGRFLLYCLIQFAQKRIEEFRREPNFSEESLKLAKDALWKVIQNFAGNGADRNKTINEKDAGDEFNSLK